MMIEFHSNSVIPRGGNASFFVFIPKMENPQHLNHFRPMSLIGCCYKIMVKILSKWLREVLPDLIDECQSTFLGGQNILDSVLVANEIVDGAKNSKAACFIFKADFEKAYDPLRWNFLYSLIGVMGFPDICIRWIKECIESASVLVLVNGSPTEEFKIRRGLRQGDPLATFLFSVVVEGLAALMKRAVQKKLFIDTNVGTENLSVSCLRFANDTVFFGDASM